MASESKYDGLVVSDIKTQLETGNFQDTESAQALITILTSISLELDTLNKASTAISTLTNTSSVSNYYSDRKIMPSTNDSKNKAANSDNEDSGNASALTESVRKIDAGQKSDKGQTTETKDKAPVKKEKPEDAKTPGTSELLDSKSMPSLTISGAGALNFRNYKKTQEEKNESTSSTNVGMSGAVGVAISSGESSSYGFEGVVG